MPTDFMDIADSGLSAPERYIVTRTFLMLSVVILVPAGITTELLVWRAVEHHPAFETGFSLDSFTYDTVFSHNFIFIDLRATAGTGSGG